MPFGAPVGLLAVVISTAVAWIAVALGWSDILQPSAVSDAVARVALYIPFPTGDVITGLQGIAPLLATAIPLGIYNFTEAMSNVESAAAAGDRYSARAVLTADGLGAIVGSFLGSPFPPAVYIGHPGWKQAGGRIGYSLVTGIVVAVLCFSGTVGILLGIFPMQALVPILLYIGLVIGAQAFNVSALRYAPAIIIAMLPSLAQWATGLIDNALGAAGTNAGEVGIDNLIAGGVVYDGLVLFGSGAVLAGVLLGAITVFIIDHRFWAAAVTAGIAAVLSFFGIINATSVGHQRLVRRHARLRVLRGDHDRVRTRQPGRQGAAARRQPPVRQRHADARSRPARQPQRCGVPRRRSARHRTTACTRSAMSTRACTRSKSDGASIPGELYAVPMGVLLKVIEGEPPGLYRGPVELADGRVVPGILFDEQAAKKHPDITKHGGWRAYTDSKAKSKK